MLIYGLSTCTLCQRARKDIEAAGHEVAFRDVRADPLSDVEIDTLVAEFGNRLVDRTSPDFRSLNDWLKNAEVEAQISAKPKVMARPVIQVGDRYHLGWDERVKAAVLAD